MISRTIGIAASVIALTAAAAQAQSTPQELAGVIRSAIAAGDTAAVRGLVHPASATFAGADRVAATIRGILRKTELGATSPNGQINVRVVAVDEMERYDVGDRTYRLGPLSFAFSASAAPTHFLFIDRTETTSTDSGIQVKNRGIVEGIVHDGSRWVLTVSQLAR